MEAIGAHDELSKFCDVVGVESGTVCPGSQMVRPHRAPAVRRVLVPLYRNRTR